MWDCVHLDGTPRIEVKRALRFEHNQPVVSEKLKTAASHRVIPIPPTLVDCLLHLKEISISEYHKFVVSGYRYKNRAISGWP